MSQTFQRALLLYQQRRYDLAEQELRQLFTAEPSHAFGHAILAMCLSDLKRFDEATREAHQAIHLAPDFPVAHYALAYVLYDRNRLQEAQIAIEEAIRLEPDDADNFGMLAAIRLGLRDWKAALTAAEMGLQVNAEHAQCTNIRAMALVKLGRRDEAGTTIDAALERNPENAVSHANMGWTLLHARQPLKAMEHFREALRLDPDMEWARHGIVEAMKARNFIYRWLLAYFLWMARLSGKVQFAVIIGLYLAFRFLSNYSAEHPEAAPYVYPLLIAYAVFALLTWIGGPLFNLLLRLNKFGRLVLSKMEISAANWLAVCLGSAIFCGALFVYSGEFPLLVAALASGALSVPVSATLRREGWPRTVLIIYTAALAGLGAASVAASWYGLGEEAPDWSPPLFQTCSSLFILGWILFGWVANALSLARVRR